MGQQKSDDSLIWVIVLVALFWWLSSREQKAETTQQPSLAQAWQRRRQAIEPASAPAQQDQVIYKNTEEWEIVTDPVNGDITKIIVHRTATRRE